MAKPQIKEIIVSKLFGSINYDIHIPKGDPIAIITAPNGKGKTTILNLIAFSFNPSTESFNAIKNIPFDMFQCVLSNEMIVELRRTKHGTNQTNPRRRKNEQTDVNRGRTWGDDERNLLFSIIAGDHVIDKLAIDEELYNSYNISDPRLLDIFDDEEEELLNYLSQDHPGLQRGYAVIWRKMQMMLRSKKCYVSINYIKADRIQPQVSIAKLRHFSDPRKMDQFDPLAEACKKIGECVTEATDKYYDEVSQAKDKLPQMFLEDKVDVLSYGEFLKGWSDYRKDLSQFQSIGLITPTEDFIQGKDIEAVYQEKGQFLSAYLQAFGNTTYPLIDLYERLSLFKSILDERNAITGKKAYFSRDGIRLVVDDRSIPLNTLSSGEKHDFIMFYNLIMGCETNGIVLIDEPEISLHIEWQETYLDKLMSICKMNGLQAIIATHSPNIVSSHYDLLVDKGETNG